MNSSCLNKLSTNKSTHRGLNFDRSVSTANTKCVQSNNFFFFSLRMDGNLHCRVTVTKQHWTRRIYASFTLITTGCITSGGGFVVEFFESPLIVCTRTRHLYYPFIKWFLAAGRTVQNDEWKILHFTCIFLFLSPSNLLARKSFWHYSEHDVFE